ncbi:MAG: pilus assembly protein PilM, partial [Candidatus Eremiobacterota bacterium]
VVHDYFVENNNYYITMDYVEGYNLKDILKNNNYRGLPAQEVIDLGIQICNILEYLHCQSPPVIHRDIKPANIIKNDIDGIITLVDFGIAGLFENNGTVSIAATPGYAPPEQLTGKAVIESDIYALGVTLYQLLAGCKTEELCKQQFSFQPLSSLRSDINSFLSRAIEKATEIKIKNRFSSAKEMKEALIMARGERDTGNDIAIPDWLAGDKRENEEDFTMSSTHLPLSQDREEDYTNPAPSHEKEEHLQKLLGLNYKAYSEHIESSPFLIHVPVQNHIFKGIAGIDIDSSFIKLLQIDKDGKNFIYPATYMIIPAPKGSFKEDNFYNPASVAKSIKKFIVDTNINVENIYFSVPPYGSITRTLIVPVKDSKKLSSIIKEDISSYLSFPYSKANLEVELLCRSIPGNEGCMKILVSAINKDFINKLESIGKSLGVKFNIIPAHRAMYRTLQMSGAEKNNTAIVNISAIHTTITVIRDGMIEQTGSFKGGFNDFVADLARGKDISLNKARELIGDVEIDITRADEQHMNLFHIIVPSIREWITRLIKLFSSFGSNYKLNKNNYSSLFLCGEGATIKCFNTFTGNQIGIKCHNFMMPEGEKNNNFPESYAPHFMTCLGLCMDNVYKDGHHGERIEIKNSLLSSLFGY